MPKTIVHFEIPASDVERLSKFYSDCFGWKFTKAEMPGIDYWLISTGPRGKSVGGGMFKKEVMPGARPVNYVNVNSIDAAIEKLKQAGGNLVVPKQEVPGQGWTAVGTDPEGNPVGLWQAIRQAVRRARRAAAKPRKPKRRK